MMKIGNILSSTSVITSSVSLSQLEINLFRTIKDLVLRPLLNLSYPESNDDDDDDDDDGDSNGEDRGFHRFLRRVRSHSQSENDNGADSASTSSSSSSSSSNSDSDSSHILDDGGGSPDEASGSRPPTPFPT
ncbi:unnamed protein product [Hymenolepis diminuta]|uniref:Wsv025 n=1 Tax=Hymenolepis diminuta TaxID=6216 RepID=A0A0R3SMW4_HYMDI|nr:unnamed protein product [Hymenolepis diminuta]